MESALLVDIDVACSGLGPRVLMMVRDSGSFCFLSSSKRAFMSLSTGFILLSAGLVSMQGEGNPLQPPQSHDCPKLARMA